MKQPSIDRGLQLVAAAVLVALGTTTAVAQQPGSEQQPAEAQQPGIEQQQPAEAQPGIEQQQPETSQSQQRGDLQADPSEQQSSAGTEQLDQIAEEHDDLSTFIEAVKAAGMTESLTGGTEYTVFAPTNDAFEQMSGMSTEELMRPENRERLISVLRAHIVADDVDQELASTLEQAQTIDGGTVEIDASQEPMRVGDASVVESDIQAGSLRVYAIDQVLSQGTELARADELGEPSDAESEESDPLRDDPLGGQREEPTDDPLGGERDDPFGEQSDDPLGGQSDDPLGGQSDDPLGGQSEGAGASDEEQPGSELGR